MKLKVKGLRAKRYASGIFYYWEPTPLERKGKWQGLKLGTDMVAAVKAAEARNAEIEEWKTGGAKPRQVKRYIARATVGAAIEKYRTEILTKQSPNTQRTAGTPLRRLEAWAGDMPVAWVTRARVRALRDAMLKPAALGGIGHHAAFHVLERGRIVWKWLVDEEAAAENPFTSFGLGKPAPRQVYWEDRHVAAIGAAALAEQQSMIGLAVELGLYVGQREADILAMPLSSWREIPRSKFRADPAIWETLSRDAVEGPDAGKVMGLYVRQGKTKRWVGIPIEGDARRRVEGAIKHARAAGRLTILGNTAGAPWSQDDFIKRFGKVRTRAVDDARAAGDDTLAAELEALWFGDLRRSCVVYLGELGLDDAAIAAITGHSLATLKTILETYMPRTEGMAARAIMARRIAGDDRLEQERKDKAQ